MIVGGDGAEGISEIVDLNNSTGPCKSIPACPLKEQQMGTFMNDHAYICGGKRSSSSGVYTECYYYNNRYAFTVQYFQNG